MPVTYENDTIICTKRVYEETLEPLKEALDGLKKPIVVDLTACEDMHGAVVQLFCAYHATFGCTFLFNEKPSVYKMAIEGFKAVENDCY